MKRQAMSVSVWALLAVAGVARSQAVQELRGHADLHQTAAVGKGVAAFPRLEATGDVTAPAAARVNASLARLDLSVTRAAAECRKGARRSSNKEAGDLWSRTIEVTMRGPRFLSLIATDSYSCGAAYPSDGIVLPLVYDLSTGLPVNWLNYLPAGAKSELSDSADGAKMGVVTWPALSARAHKEASADCKDSFAGDADADVQFVLWLDAKTAKVVAQPSSFPHAMAACANTVELSVSDARTMGMHGAVLDALAALARAK